MAVVMTTTFVRHVLDGGQCTANVKRLFNGLDSAIVCLGDAQAKQLGGWVSDAMRFDLMMYNYNAFNNAL